MKILHTVESYYPSVGGAQEAVKQLLERLVKRGHQVTVATSYHPERKNTTINGVKIESFKISGNAVRGYEADEKEIKRYKRFLIQSNFDVIVNHAAQQWATDIALPILNKIKAKKVFLPTGFSGLYLPEYKEYFENMKIWMKKYDLNIFRSNHYRDINFARKWGVKNIALVSGGADTDEFLSRNTIDIRKRLGIPKKDFLILHVGSHTGLKGHTEAIEIFKKAKIIDSTFLIVGNRSMGGCLGRCRLEERLFRFSPLRLFDRKKLVITSFSRKETVAAYKEVDLFLFPSNIECSPLVLFECMASKTPFLVTDVGNSKEIIKWSKSGILLPTIKDKNGYSHAIIADSIKILENIYYHPRQRKRMAELGFASWKKNFTWQKITSDYENLYRKLINN